MARYQLRVHNQDQSIDYVVPINNETGRIDETYKKKSELFAIDHYILENFTNKEELLEHLKQYNFYVTDDMIPYISYQNNKKKQVLEVIYHADVELRDFAYMFCQLSQRNLSKTEKQKIFSHYEEWQAFISDLYERIFDNEFYDFLKDNLYYIKPYAYNCIATIRDNARWERQEESDYYHMAMEGLMEIYTSYKQIRGMKLAIRAFETELLRQEKFGAKDDSDFVSGLFQTGDEVLDSYIGLQNGADYNEELLKLYSLDELESLDEDVRGQIQIDGMSR